MTPSEKTKKSNCPVIKPYVVLSTFLVACVVNTASAHLEHNKNVRTEVKGYTSFTYRSDAVVEPGQSFQIPGALMGGEALPQEKGFNFDEALLEGTLNTEHHYYVSAKLSAHSADAIEVENLSITIPEISYLADSTVDIGKISTKASPIANWHASKSAFSESSLLGDVFFGRHFNDTGVRLERNFGFLLIGAEAFNGNNWPASPGEGTASAFLQTRFTFGEVVLQMSGWGMKSRAENRTDIRYTGSHSHGGNVVSSPSTEYFFSGDIDMAGAGVKATYRLSKGEIFAEGEWIQSESDGQIANSTQSSLYQNQYDGYRLALGLRYAKHMLELQYEEVALMNDLLSPVTSVFAENANLVNNDFEPSKGIMGWTYNLNNDVRLRLEAVSEKTVSMEEVNKINFGFVWQRSLYQ